MRFLERSGAHAGVDGCWSVQPGTAQRSLVPADGAVDVVVRLLAPGAAAQLRVEAATARAFEVELAPSACVFGVRLVLGYGEPLRQQHRALVAQAEALWNARELSLESLERMVASRLERPPAVIADFVQEAKLREGAVRLSQGAGGRALQRAARRWLGLRPKTLLRIERARAAAAALTQGEPAVEVACRLGYADQPHLTRELGVLLGRTPASCRKSARPAPEAPAHSGA